MSIFSSRDKRIEELEERIVQQKIAIAFYKEFIKDLKEKADAFKEENDTGYQWYMEKVIEQEQLYRVVLQNTIDTHKMIEKRLFYPWWLCWF